MLNEADRSSIITLILGTLVGGSLVLAAVQSEYRPLSLYIAVLAMFHFLEFLLTSVNHPSSISTQGLVFVILGQSLRSAAIIQAGQGFTHHVAFVKRPSHKLICHGVYSWMRHPSYAGYLFWALGTQILLLNPLCLAIYSIALYRFFIDRICLEEKYLVRFFADEYLAYKSRTPSGLPGIK